MKIDQLRELARLYSIQLTYVDSAGKKRNAGRDSLLAALRMREPRLADGADPAELLETRKHEIWSRLVEPVIVSWGGKRIEVELRLPQSARDASLRWELTLEDGPTLSGTADLGGCAPEWDEALGREHFIGKTLIITPEKQLPFGYHTLRVDVANATAEAMIVVAPSKAYAPRASEKRSWGIFAPVYAMQTESSWGTGDLGDLQRYAAWIHEQGGGVVATLPMLATFYGDLADPSPYSPVSRLFWNELYLDLTRIPEFEESDRNSRIATIEELRGLKRVDYDRAYAVKRAALHDMAERFFSSGGGTRLDEFESFAKNARDYARFRAYVERVKKPWRDWDDAPKGGEITDGDVDDGAVRDHLYAQWNIATQMREVADDARRSGLGLYLDFPLGVNSSGYDAWRYREHFASGISVGSPPDPFFTKGQNWGFPPFDPDAIREQRHSYFRAAIRNQLEHAGLLRIDHVMGLQRLFWIPEGGEAKDGVYVRYPEDELYAILAIESQRTRSIIVGEDLGTVPTYVPKTMSRRGVRQMYVVQYELKPEGDEPAGKPPAASVASINTHDMPTFAAFWGAKDVDDRLEQELLDDKSARRERETREQMRAALTAFLTDRNLLQEATDDRVRVLEALVAFLGSSEAEVVLVTLEDLWLEPEPQNTPGVAERSWRKKMRLDLDAARSDQRVAAMLRSLNRSRRQET